jgi:hypothetical protein
MRKCPEERCDLSSHESYTTSRELHQDFAKFMMGRGFVPTQQVFFTRIEGINWICAAKDC